MATDVFTYTSGSKTLTASIVVESSAPAYATPRPGPLNTPRDIADMLLDGRAVTFESLLQPGHGETKRTEPDGGIYRTYAAGAVNKAIGKVPSGKAIVFDRGVYEYNEPGWTNGEGNNALYFPKFCAGAHGFEPGGTILEDMKPSTVRTELRMKPNTASTSKNAAGSAITAGRSGSIPFHMSNLVLGGTDQGMQNAGGGNIGSPGIDGKLPRVFNNFFGYGMAPGSTAKDVFSYGSSGTNGAPLGETFDYYWHGGNYGYGTTLHRINTDGRRYVGGPIHASVGLSVANMADTHVVDCQANYHSHAGFVNFQSFNTHVWNLRLGDRTDNKVVHVALGYNRGNWLNQENTGGAIYYAPVLNVVPSKDVLNEHVSHSNDSFSMARNGVAYTAKDGSLTIYDPVWSKTLFAGSGYPLTIASWGPIYNKQEATTNTPPKVIKADGSKVSPVKWNRYGTWTDI